MDMDVYGHFGFGLTGPPFAVTPDPRFAYGTEEHTLAITKITYSVQAHRGLFLLQGAIGTGKCLGRGTPVLLFNGTVKPVEDIRVGDLLMGPDSGPRRVLSLARGIDRLYKVVPVKGDPYIVNEPHVLSLKRTQMTRGRGRAYGMRPQSGQIVNLSVGEYLGKSNFLRTLQKDGGCQ